MALTREQFQALRDKGLSVDQIVRFERGERGQTLAPTPAAPVPAPPQGESGAIDISSTLAAPGGFLPGPMGRGLSALGGLIGEPFDQWSRGQPISAGGAIREAGKQALLTSGGQMLGGASRAIGTGLMRTALRPGVNTVRRAPEAVKDALEQTATVRRFMGTGGEEKAAEVMGQRGAVTAKGIERVDRLGIPLPGGATARVNVHLSKMIPRIPDVISAQTSRRAADKKEAVRVIREMTASYRRPRNLAEVKAATQQLDDEARAVYETAIPSGKNLRFNASGIPIGEEVPIEARIKFGTAHKLREFMRSIPEGATGIPGGLKASEAATAKAIGVRKAVSDATLRGEAGLPTWFPQGFGRGAITAGGGAIGAMQGDSPQEHTAGGAIGALAGGMLSDPGVTSRLSHLFYQQYLLPLLLRQSPRAGFMLYNGGEMPPDTLESR